LAQAGGANGDQWLTNDSIAGANILLTPDTNIVFTPAVADGATSSYWRYSEGAWTEDSFSVTGSGLRIFVDNVNGSNTIQSTGVIAINGDFPFPAQSVTLGGASLTISSQTPSVVNCAPVDIHTADLPYGEHSLVVDDGNYQESILVVVTPSAANQYKTMAGLIPNGILKDVAGAADGDQVEIQKYYNSDVIELFEDGDVRFYPKLSNDTTITRWWHNGVTWDSGPITIFQGSFDEVSWVGTPSPPPSVTGKPYSYSMSSLIVGDRPVTLTVTKGQLPPGLSLNSSEETIQGTTSAVGTFPDIEITANNELAKLTVKTTGA
jgi:hypothetical protein